MDAHTHRDPPPDAFGLVGATLDGKHRVERVVAEGGFGVVYAGTHATLARPIAIKVLKIPGDLGGTSRAAFVAKFTDEARVIAQLNHPSIVQVLDHGVLERGDAGALPWIVLEWLEGQTLEQWLAARAGQPRITPGEALGLLHPIFEALAFAHHRGVAHRDLKPANIMVVPAWRGFSLRLMDFGIAKIMEPDEVATGGATNTRSVIHAFSPGFAAPEQFAGGRTGPWTDVHALALLMCEVITGEPAYRGKDPTEWIFEATNPQRPTPGHYGVDVGAWESILARALALRPDGRQRDAGELLDQLERALPSGATRLPAEIPVALQPTAYADVSSRQAPTTARSSAVSRDVVRFASPRGLRIAATLAAIGLLSFVVAAVAVLRGRNASVSSRGATPTTTAQPAPAAPPGTVPFVPAQTTNGLPAIPSPPLNPAPTLAPALVPAAASLSPEPPVTTATARTIRRAPLTRPPTPAIRARPTASPRRTPLPFRIQ